MAHKNGLQPYTDKTIEKLTTRRKKNVLVISPGFSSDCVETLEEISIQAKEKFLKSGGINFDMVPCLNDNDDHIKLLKYLITKKYLMNFYLLFKSLHLIAVISWMAGFLYLPRIFVYHVENKEKKDATDIFEVMERRLFIYIMRPAMILTWAFWNNINSS